MRPRKARNVQKFGAPSRVIKSANAAFNSGPVCGAETKKARRCGRR